MRHEQIAAKGSYRKVDIAAKWPAGTQVAPLPISEPHEPASPQHSASAAPDVPAAVGKLIIASYVGLLSAFALATVASSYSVYVVTIAGLFLVAFFTIPWLFFRQERNGSARPSFDRFMRKGMDTLTGHSSGGAALVQMMIVPVFLTVGVAAMGIAAAIYL